MNERIFCQVLLTEEENWFVATDINTGVASQGKSFSEAMDNLREALELYYEDVPAADRVVSRRAYLTTMELSL